MRSMEQTRIFRHWLWASVLVFICGVALRWYGLGHIEEQVFDEFHYVPAAEVLVGLKPHPGMGAWSFHPLLNKAPAPNFEHPLLGKFFIGLGMKIFGVQAFGWRFFSAVFGCISLFLMGALALKFFKDQRLAVLALGMLSFESLHILHSRLAMLDIFLMTGVTGLLFSAYLLLQNPERWSLRFATAFWIALGLSSKWVFAFAILAFSLSVLLLARAGWKTRFRTLTVVGLMALGLYHLWFPYYAAYGFSYGEWLQFHVDANTITTGKVALHPYAATAFSMLINRPNIWYYFKQLPDQTTFGLVGLMNPALIFSVIPAFVILLVNARSRDDLFLLLWLSLCYLPFHLVLMQRPGFIYYLLLLEPIFILVVIRALQMISPPQRLPWVLSVFALIFLGFGAFFMPVLYAWPMPPAFYLRLIELTGV